MSFLLLFHYTLSHDCVFDDDTVDRFFGVALVVLRIAMPPRARLFSNEKSEMPTKRRKTAAKTDSWIEKARQVERRETLNAGASRMNASSY